MSTTISGTSGVTFPDSTSMQTGQQACKAWVNFNSTGTVAIRAAYNVSSITDENVGAYIVNFTTALTDADFAVGASAGNGAGASRIITSGYANTPTTLTTKINVRNSAFATVDTEYVSVAIFSN